MDKMYLRFQVSVKNFSVMNMFEGKSYLNKPIQNLWLNEIYSLNVY